MTLSVLSLALALQGVPDHAALHPADTVLYLEVPDVPSAVGAHARAPVLEILREKEMAAFLGTLGLGDMEPGTWLVDLLGEWLPGTDVTPQLAALERLSLSLAPAADEALAAPALRLVLEYAAVENASAALDQLAPASASGERSLMIAGEELACRIDGTRLILSGGSADDPPTEGGLAQTLELGQAREVLAPEGGIALFNLFVRSLGGSSLADLADEEIDYHDLADDVNTWWALDLAMAGNRFVYRSFAPRVWKLLGGSPIAREQLGEIPGGAMFAGALSFDGPAYADALDLVIELFDEEGSFVATFQDRLGFAPGTLLRNLGPRATVYAFPISGIGLPQSFVWIDAADPEALRKYLDQVFTTLGESNAGLTARTRDYKIKNKATDERVTIPVTTITLPQGALALGPMFAVSPAYAIVEGRFLCGVSAMHVKRELKRRYGGVPDESVHPLATEAYAVPEDARAVLYMDWGLQLTAALELARALGGLVGDELPFDLGALPSAEVITRHLKPTFTVARIVDGGTFIRHESSFGPETWGALLLAAILALPAADQALTELEEPAHAASDEH